MYPLFRKTVESLIKKFGKMNIDEFYATDAKTIKIIKPNYLDFSIEKNGNRLFVGYYREQAGDLISDPIFVFEIKDNRWHPIRLEQVLGETLIGQFENGCYYYYPGNFKDVKSFASTCAKEWRFYYL
ncbi:DUF6908 domain-containing protein [Brevibacillus sp. NPDC058079]|uniref:DUF6908 domain-containing protein n=1 Tax=Brevibacillus sp. NPDC058079 TaxID=3346330 RepID=UPI0036E67FA3